MKVIEFEHPRIPENAQINPDQLKTLICLSRKFGKENIKIAATLMFLGFLTSCVPEPASLLDQPCTQNQINEHHWGCSPDHFDPTQCELLSNEILRADVRFGNFSAKKGSRLCMTRDKGSNGKYQSEMYQIVDDPFLSQFQVDSKWLQPHQGCYNLNTADFRREWCSEEENLTVDFLKDSWGKMKCGLLAIGGGLLSGLLGYTWLKKRFDYK